MLSDFGASVNHPIPNLLRRPDSKEAMVQLQWTSMKEVPYKNDDYGYPERNNL